MSAYKLMPSGVMRTADGVLIPHTSPLYVTEYLPWSRVGQWQKQLDPDSGRYVDVWVGNTPDPMDAPPPPAAAPFNHAAAIAAYLDRIAKKKFPNDPVKQWAFKQGVL